jgi:hypothetical protein
MWRDACLVKKRLHQDQIWNLFKKWTICFATIQDSIQHWRSVQFCTNYHLLMRTTPKHYWTSMFYCLFNSTSWNLGRSLPYEVQNYVRPDFATPMLYAKNHSKFHNFFCRAIKPSELYFVNFWTSYSSIWNLYNYFCNYLCCCSSKWWILYKKRLSNFIIILWYTTNTFSILYMEFFL